MSRCPDDLKGRPCPGEGQPLLWWVPLLVGCLEDFFDVAAAFFGGGERFEIWAVGVGEELGALLQFGAHYFVHY
jgi:hypothetical protein